MIQYDQSPIEIEIQRIANRLERVCGSSYQTCDKCGEKGRGFSNLMEGMQGFLSQIVGLAYLWSTSLAYLNASTAWIKPAAGRSAAPDLALRS